MAVPVGTVLGIGRAALAGTVVAGPVDIVLATVVAVLAAAVVAPLRRLVPETVFPALAERIALDFLSWRSPFSAGARPKPQSGIVVLLVYYFGTNERVASTTILAQEPLLGV